MAEKKVTVKTASKKAVTKKVTKKKATTKKVTKKTISKNVTTAKKKVSEKNIDVEMKEDENTQDANFKVGEESKATVEMKAAVLVEKNQTKKISNEDYDDDIDADIDDDDADDFDEDFDDDIDDVYIEAPEEADEEASEDSDDESDDDFDEEKDRKEFSSSTHIDLEVDDDEDLDIHYKGKNSELDQKIANEVKELSEKISHEITDLQEAFKIDEIRQVISEIDFFNTNTSDECSEKHCDNLKTTMGHCRYHYIKNWKKLKRKRAILNEGKLQEYITELVTKYPAKYIEAIMEDLQGEKQFYQVLKDLNLDSQFQFEDGDSELEADDDISAETRTYSGSRNHYDDEEII